MFAMVQQSLTFEARVAEVALCAVEAAASSRLAMGRDIGQAWTFVHRVAWCQIGSCGERLATIAPLLAATMRLLLLWWCRRRCSF
jgi:predicted RNA-binding Zn ribbon-like protein